jgi:hypothetical protein
MPRPLDFAKLAVNKRKTKISSKTIFKKYPISEMNRMYSV